MNISEWVCSWDAFFRCGRWWLGVGDCDSGGDGVQWWRLRQTFGRQQHHSSTYWTAQWWVLWPSWHGITAPTREVDRSSSLPNRKFGAEKKDEWWWWVWWWRWRWVYSWKWSWYQWFFHILFLNLCEMFSLFGTQECKHLNSPSHCLLNSVLSKCPVLHCYSCLVVKGSYLFLDKSLGTLLLSAKLCLVSGRINFGRKPHPVVLVTLSFLKLPALQLCAWKTGKSSQTRDLGPPPLHAHTRTHTLSYTHTHTHTHTHTRWYSE